MRWHVYGTDVGTGQDVVLALNEEEATHAVQTAISKRILVSHVTREAGEGLRRMLLPFAMTVAIVLIPLCIAVYAQNMSIRSRLNRAVEEQKRLAQIAAQAESLASQIRQGSSQDSSAQMAQLIEQLASARTRAAQTEQQLNRTFQEISALERRAGEVTRLESALASSAQALDQARGDVDRLTKESALQRRRVEEQVAVSAAAETALREKLGKAQSLVKGLEGEIEALKGQLLIAAAASATRPAPDATVPPAPAQPTRWAMRTSFDAASELLRLQFAKETFRSEPAGEGIVASSGASPTNAVTLRIIHDQEKSRVYSATLDISLAPDGPPERISENRALILQFLKVFAPSAEKPDALLAAALSHIHAKSEPGERWGVLGADFRLTVWQVAPGQYVFRVQSPRVEFEE